MLRAKHLFLPISHGNAEIITIFKNFLQIFFGGAFPAIKAIKLPDALISPGRKHGVYSLREKVNRAHVQAAGDFLCRRNDAVRHFIRVV